MKKYVIERQYLTFDELVERWGVSKTDVHYLIASARLVPSIVWNDRAEVCKLETAVSGHEFNLVPCVDPSDGVPLIEFPRGWMYLRLPRVIGAHDKYYFSYVTCEHRSFDDFSNPEKWYRLLGEENNRTYRVDAAAVEKIAVFMFPIIENCEATFRVEQTSKLAVGPVVEKSDDEKSTQTIPFPVTPISSPTFSRIQKAVEAFPLKYPNYAESPPKLDIDVRVWLKTSGLAINDTEKRVFGTILFEHFNLSGNTRKVQ